MAKTQPEVKGFEQDNFADYGDYMKFLAEKKEKASKKKGK